MMLKVVFAFSETESGLLGFGNKGGLPWKYCKEDLANFKKVTENSIVLMGSNTWKSLPKALPNRINVVMSSEVPSNKAGQVPDMVMKSDLKTAILELCVDYPDKDVCVIGGVSLIKEAITIADEVHITEVKTVVPVEADVTLSDDIFDYLYDNCESESETTIQCESKEFDRLFYYVFKMGK